MNYKGWIFREIKRGGKYFIVAQGPREYENFITLGFDTKDEAIEKAKTHRDTYWGIWPGY